MRIVDCAAGTGRSITDHGSRFSLVPLMSPTDLARTVVLHLDADDEVGAHEASCRQLFLVLRGSGWVAAADGVRVPLGEDQAAIFEAGEVHAAGTSVGMVAICVEGDFRPLDP